MKERDVIGMFRTSMLALAKEQDAPLFIYKIPDPPLVSRPGGGKFPAGRRPYDVEMSWGGRDWHIEFKISKLKGPMEHPERLMSAHQQEALELRVKAGRGVSLLAVYYEARRELYLRKITPIPPGDSTAIIERKGAGFSTGGLQNALERLPV